MSIASVINTGGRATDFYANVSTGANGVKQIHQTDGIEELVSTGSRTVLKAGPYQIDMQKGHLLLREYSANGSLEDGKGRKFDSLDLRDGGAWKSDGQKVPALVGQEQPYTLTLPTEFGKPPVKLTVESTRNAETGRWEASKVTVVNGSEAVQVEGLNTADGQRIASKTYTQGQAVDQAVADGRTLEMGEQLGGFFVRDEYGTRFAATKLNVNQANPQLPVTAATVTNGQLSTSAPASTASTSSAAGTAAPKVSTSVVNGKKEITIDDGNYTIVARESGQSIKVTDKLTGKSFEAYGDPHLKSNGVAVGDFKSDLMVQLPKGGSIIIKTVAASGDAANAKATYASEVTYVKGAHAVSVEGLGKGDGKMRIGEITSTGGQEIFSNAKRNNTDIHLRMGNDGQLYSTLHEAQNKDSLLTGTMLKQLDVAAEKRQAVAHAAASTPAAPAVPSTSGVPTQLNVQSLTAQLQANNNALLLQLNQLSGRANAPAAGSISSSAGTVSAAVVPTSTTPSANPTQPTEYAGLFQDLLYHFLGIGSVPQMPRPPMLG